jgi:predicted RNA-binding Zn ribbon-like protein
MTVDADTDETFLLELLNSTPITDDGRQDLLGSARAARPRLRAWGGTGSSREWQAAREARDVLQAVVRGRLAADALAPVLLDAAYRASIAGGGIEWTLEVAADRALATRAVLSWDTLRRTSPGRLRPCQNPDCALFLIDHSKPNTARWCSMAVCGNRMKARRHYERRRPDATGQEV